MSTQKQKVNWIRISEAPILMVDEVTLTAKLNNPDNLGTLQPEST
jgi:hypothetical protein